MPRALVTGGTGLVGSHIVERLVRDHWSVRALVRAPSRTIESLGGECFVGDVFDGGHVHTRGLGMRRHLPQRRGNHAEWRLGIVPSFERRWNQPRHRGAAANSARLVQLSSVAVYGPTGRYRADGLTTDEETPLAPLPEGAFYARSKRESEDAVMAACRAGRIWATALRPDGHLRSARSAVRAATRAPAFTGNRAARRRRRVDLFGGARGERGRRRGARSDERRRGGTRLQSRQRF